MLQIERDLPIYRQAIISRHEPITDKQAELMLHAIGADNKKSRHYMGRKIYKAYRNYYDAGGSDIELWDDLVSKGYADKSRFYHVTHYGLEILGLITNSTIYGNYHNVADCRKDVLEQFMRVDAYHGYGCWFPTSAKAISKVLHIPLQLARETARSLADEGLIKKGHCGGMDCDGEIHCIHGYFLTDKAREKYSERYEELKKAEYAYINGEGKDNE